MALIRSGAKHHDSSSEENEEHLTVKTKEPPKATFDTIKQLMTEREYPLVMPRGWFSWKVIGSSPDTDADVLGVLVRERLYKVSEVEYNFWILLYHKYLNCA